MSKDFISLREFLSLTEHPGEKNEREFTQPYTGLQWVRWYDLARSSFLRFGEEGPPVGTVVEVLHHGSGMRTFAGVHPEYPTFFRLIQPKEIWTTIVSRACWWREFRIVEHFSIVWERAMTSGLVSLEELKAQFPHWHIDDRLVDNWLRNQPHWNREDAMLAWFRTKGILC
jgi:hypothetical protein